MQLSPWLYQEDNSDMSYINFTVLLVNSLLVSCLLNFPSTYVPRNCDAVKIGHAWGKVVSAHFVTIAYPRHKYVSSAPKIPAGEYISTWAINRITSLISMRPLELCTLRHLLIHSFDEILNSLDYYAKKNSLSPFIEQPDLLLWYIEEKRTVILNISFVLTPSMEIKPRYN